MGDPSEEHRRGDPVPGKFAYLKQTVWENDIWMKVPASGRAAPLEKQLDDICDLLLPHRALLKRLIRNNVRMDVYFSFSTDSKQYVSIQAAKLQVLSDLGVDLTLSILPTTLYPRGYLAQA